MVDEAAVERLRPGRVVAIEGSGSVLVDGRPGVGRRRTAARRRARDRRRASDHRATRQGDADARAGLEDRGDARPGALILALERGAVEAQVVPVAAGEAFAVDVEGSRVAVHGTHLRVARDGERVVVDLNEGVVSIGEAPRTGSVLGTLVNAPAHVEFTAADAAGTLTQTHDPAGVRPADAARLAPAASVLVRSPQAQPSAARHARRVRPARCAPRSVRRRDEPPGPRSSAPEPTAEEAIATAVRACMAERPRADNVTVVVSTTLHLDLARRRDACGSPASNRRSRRRSTRARSPRSTGSASATAEASRSRSTSRTDPTLHLARPGGPLFDLGRAAGTRRRPAERRDALRPAAVCLNRVLARPKLRNEPRRALWGPVETWRAARASGRARRHIGVRTSVKELRIGP